MLIDIPDDVGAVGAEQAQALGVPLPRLIAVRLKLAFGLALSAADEELLEDLDDVRDAQQAREEGEPLPWDQVKAELGL